jgi:cbb3-type cytochrome oxidase subunit 3
MKLGDIMAGAGLAAYAEIALILFFFAFLLVVVATFWPKLGRGFEAASRMPLDDNHVQEPRSTGDL